MTNPDKTGKRILVINDDPAILALFQELLCEEGYEVTLDKFARTTGDLLQSIRETKPDLVIMDFVIGREDSGWQLLQAAQMDRQTRDVPIIVCTGAVKQVTELSDHLEEMGVRVVLKPFDIDHLLTVIEAVWAGSPAPRSVLPVSPGGSNGGRAKDVSAAME